MTRLQVSAEPTGHLHACPDPPRAKRSFYPRKKRRQRSGEGPAADAGPAASQPSVADPRWASSHGETLGTLQDTRSDPGDAQARVTLSAGGGAGVDADCSAAAPHTVHHVVHVGAHGGILGASEDVPPEPEREASPDIDICNDTEVDHLLVFPTSSENCGSGRPTSGGVHSQAGTCMSPPTAEPGPTPRAAPLGPLQQAVQQACSSGGQPPTALSNGQSGDRGPGRLLLFGEPQGGVYPMGGPSSGVGADPAQQEERQGGVGPAATGGLTHAVNLKPAVGPGTMQDDFVPPPVPGDVEGVLAGLTGGSALMGGAGLTAGPPHDAGVASDPLGVSAGDTHGGGAPELRLENGFVPPLGNMDGGSSPVYEPEVPLNPPILGMGNFPVAVSMDVDLSAVQGHVEHVVPPGTLGTAQEVGGPPVKGAVTWATGQGITTIGREGGMALPHRKPPKKPQSPFMIFSAQHRCASNPCDGMSTDCTPCVSCVCVCVTKGAEGQLCSRQVLCH
jgi:hypothetical protein